MFGKGTFKSSGRPSASSSVTLNRPSLETKISTFNEAEKSEDVVKAVQLYSQFINEADNLDEGKRNRI